MRGALTAAAALGLIAAVLCAVVFFNELGYANSHYNKHLAQQLMILSAGGFLGCVGLASGAWVTRSLVGAE